MLRIQAAHLVECSFCSLITRLHAGKGKAALGEPVWVQKGFRGGG